MNKKLLLLTLIAPLLSGCSQTWQGVKQDTTELVLDTKEVIHNATATGDMNQAYPTQNNVTQRVPILQ